jgi:hypothetical protein
MSIIIPGSNLAPQISFTTNAKIEVVAPTLTATGTVTGLKGCGSSFFLNRVFLPAAMALTKVDLSADCRPLTGHLHDSLRKN